MRVRVERVNRSGRSLTITQPNRVRREVVMAGVSRETSGALREVTLNNAPIGSYVYMRTVASTRDRPRVCLYLSANGTRRLNDILINSPTGSRRSGNPQC